MDFIGDLWLPIVLSAVFVFVASSLIHMVLGWHNDDHGKLPNEDAVLAAMREQGVTQGSYMFPRAASMKDCGTPEMVAKFNQGPVGFMTVFPNGPINMGKALAQWFGYCLLVGIFTAYIADFAMQPGRDYLDVFRFAGTVSFMGYGLGAINENTWKGASWGVVFKFMVDGLIYALVTAGTFGWLWPDLI